MDTSNSLDLSLIIACYNEESILEKSVETIINVLDQTKYNYEIIFIDDQSKDRTREIIEKLAEVYRDKAIAKIFHQKNVGRGGSVAEGINIAQGKFVGFIDIDLESHPRYIPEILRALQNGADVATCQRIYKFSFGALDRYILSRGYSLLSRWLLKINLLDTETGAKFFNREKILPILKQVEDKHWFWDTEIMARSVWGGLRIAEVPTLFMRRPDWRTHSTVNAISDTFFYLKKLWQFRKAAQKHWGKK